MYAVSNFHVLKFILDHDILNIDIGWFVDWFPNCLSNILRRQHFVRMIPEGQRVTLNLKVSHNLPIIKKNLLTCWPDGVNVAITIFLHHSCTVLISKHLSEPLSVHKPREDVDHLHPCSFDLLSEKWKYLYVVVDLKSTQSSLVCSAQHQSWGCVAERWAAEQGLLASRPNWHLDNSLVWLQQNFYHILGQRSAQHWLKVHRVHH